MKKRIFAFVFCLVFVFAMLIPNVYGSNYKTVRVGIFNIGEFQKIDSYGYVSGYNIDYLNSIASQAHFKYEYVKVDNWVDATEKLENKEIDLLAPAQNIASLTDRFEFTMQPMGYEYGAVYVSNDRDDIIYGEYEKMAELKYGAVRNSTFTSDFVNEYCKDAGFVPNITYYENTTELFNAFEKGQVEAVVTNIMFYNNQMKLLAQFNPMPVFYITYKGNTELVNEVNIAMENIMISSPDFQTKLIFEYFPQYSTTILNYDEIQYLKSLPPINVGYWISSAPMAYLDENGEFAGATRTILDYIAKELGVEFNYIRIQGSEIDAKYIKDREINVLSDVVYNDVNLGIDNMSLSLPYIESDNVIVTKGNTDIESKGYKISVCTGSVTYKQALKTRFPNAEFVNCASVKECYENVVKGKTDALLQNRHIADVYLARPRYEKLSVVPVSGIDDNLCLSTFIYDSADFEMNTLLDDPRFISAVDKTIRRLSDNNINNIIISEAAKSNYRSSIYDIIYKYRYPLGIIVLLVIILVVFATKTGKEIAKQKNDLQRKNQMLSKAIIEAEEANRAKSDFLSKMSHEIRTPMNAIIGMTSLALYEEPKPEVKEYLNQIDSSGQYLLSIINDILDMSKIESGKFELNYEWVKPSEIYYNSVKMIKPLMEKKHINFTFDELNYIDDLQMYIDKMRATQVIMNILNNAYKFTDEGGSVSLTVEKVSNDKERCHAVEKFTVKDTGCGMSKEFLKRIYEPFAQETDNSYKKTVEGSGLGLPIVKSIVTAMGGEINIESEKGKGTTVTLTFPYSYRFVEKDVTENKKIDVSILKGKRALVVEDNAINTKVIKKLLEYNEMIVECADNGRKAVEMIDSCEEGWYDIVLMDIRMPIMDGITATNVIRNMNKDYTKKVPIIALSADVFSENEKKSKLAGVDAYITKPIEAASMLEVMAEVLKLEGKA